MSAERNEMNRTRHITVRDAAGKWVYGLFDSLPVWIQDACRAAQPGDDVPIAWADALRAVIRDAQEHTRPAGRATAGRKI